MSKRTSKTTNSAAKETQMIQQLADDNKHFSLVRQFALADAITIMNGVCGSMSIFASLQTCIVQATGHDDRELLHLAMILPFFGLFFDFMDGRVARWRKSASLLGQELDSLADLVSFGVAPAVLAFTVGMREPLDIFILTLFICCGIARLARFNATVAAIPKDATGKSKYFEGTPIPTTLGLVSLLALWEHYGWTAKAAVGTAKAAAAAASHHTYVSGGPWISGSIVSRFATGLFAPQTIITDNLPWGTFAIAGFRVHYATLLFGLSATAMVSKTLKIPKP